MFGTVVDKIGALLSRNFLLANFFPFLIFTVTNLLLADAVVPGARALFQRVFTWDSGSQALLFGTILVAIAVIAYIVSPLTAAVQQALEGKLWIPEWLENRMRTEQNQIANALKDARDRALRHNDAVSGLVNALQRQLVNANRASSALNVLGPDAANQIADAETALDAVALLATPGDAAEQAALDALRPAVQRTAVALRASATRLPNNAAAPERALAKRLAACQRRAADLVRRPANDAREALIHAQQALRGRFPVKGIWPTRIANVRAAVEAYSTDAYKVEFEFLWPRLKLALQKDEKVTAAIEAAKTQVDFLLLMVLLCVLFTAGWLAMFIALGRPLSVIVLGVLGQFTTLFFLRSVQESIKQLGQIVQATIDLYRFKVLQEMRLDLPRDLTSERALWQRLQRSSAGFGTVDIAYQRGAAS